MLTNINNKILVLGSNGMLGRALVKEGLSRNFEIIKATREDFDITNPEQIEAFIKKKRPDVVINTCAIVNHSLCETDPKLAYETNARPSAILANLADEYNFKYIYISTDGYFNGDMDLKHDENSRVTLLNEYARTKFAGEMFAITNPNSLVVRTNIVGYKKNPEKPTFVEWVINSLKKQDNITMFDDYFTSSISVTQFSEILFDILNKNQCGILNIASSQVSSKKEFIEGIAKIFGFSLANTTTGKVSSLTSSKRANSLGLDVSKAEDILGYNFPKLNDVLSQLKKDYENV